MRKVKLKGERNIPGLSMREKTGYVLLERMELGRKVLVTKRHTLA